MLRRVEGTGGGMVLPDGCMDLLWVDGRLLVAGPDTAGHRAGEVQGSGFAGIRLAPGTAPALLGVPARLLRDRLALALSRRGLAQAAVAAAGYADQEHCTREVRALAGTTPGVYAVGLAGSEASAVPAVLEAAKREIPEPSGSRTTA
ncbi:DUF6597 domain-containing transcriptional factor [Streptomyces sp. H27-H1]|uniref:DUF6597 domain-containing transcriptional factor n=1 Tax=Streptomyces sp. H27-H1 TaxID=2996461 RepID=UPI003B63B088